MARPKQKTLFGTIQCVFCDIINSKIDHYTVFDDAYSLAFLDKLPLFPGHCLLVPKIHFETFSDLPNDLIGPLFHNAQLLSRAVESAFNAEGTFVAMNNRVSQSIPHLHIHIVPRNRKDGLKGFFWPRNPYTSSDEILRAQTVLKQKISQLVISDSKE